MGASSYIKFWMVWDGMLGMAGIGDGLGQWRGLPSSSPDAAREASQASLHAIDLALFKDD